MAFCDEHPGVTFRQPGLDWAGPGCFVCDPDPQPLWAPTSETEDGPKYMGVNELVAELVASGQWPVRSGHECPFPEDVSADPLR